MNRHDYLNEVEYPDARIMARAIGRSGSVEEDLKHHRNGLIKYKDDTLLSKKIEDWIARLEKLSKEL